MVHLAHVVVLFVLALAGAGCAPSAAPVEPAAESERGETVETSPARKVLEASPEATMEGGELEDEEVSGEPAPEVEIPPADGLISIAAVERLVRADLADRLAVTDEQVETVEAEERTWLDDSFGCSSRRIVGDSLPVPGYQIVLAVGDETFDYRADQQGRFRLCPDQEDIGKPLGPIK